MTTIHEHDVVDLLLEQHNQIKELFSEIEAAQGDQKQESFQALVRLLAVHETAEEELVHPLARQKIEHGDEVVQARLHEEEEAKHALTRLYDMGVHHAEFDRQLADLKTSVVEHATREETDEFAYLRRTVDADRLRRLVSAVESAEKMAPTRPHPSAQSATANVLLGPPLAIFDRVRDAIRDQGNK